MDDSSRSLGDLRYWFYGGESSNAEFEFLSQAYKDGISAYDLLENYSNPPLFNIYKYQYSTVTDPPPNTAQIRLNADSTELYVHNQTSDSIDIRTFLLQPMSAIYIQDQQESESFVIYNITEEQISPGDYVIFKISEAEKGTIPIAGSGVILAFPWS